MRARNFFFLFLTLIVVCSLSSCQDGEPIPMGGGYYMIPTFIPITGSGELLKISILGNSSSDPPKAIFSGEGISVGNAYPEEMIVLTWHIEERELLQSPIEINWKGAMKRKSKVIASSELPPGSRVDERQSNAYSAAYLAIGQGKEQCDKVLTEIWLKPISGQNFSFWWEPWNDKSNRVEAERKTIWTFPVFLSTNTLVVQGNVNIESLDGGEIAWADKGSLFPLGTIDPFSDDSTQIVIRNVDTEIVYLGDKDSQGAPPSEETILARIEEAGIKIVQNDNSGFLALCQDGRVIAGNQRVTLQNPEVKERKKTTWGFIRSRE